MAAIDAVAAAKCVEAMLGAGVTSPRDDDRIDHPIEADRLAAAAAELPIDEAEIETGIVRDQRAVAEELEQGVDAVREQRLVRQERVAQSVNGKCAGRHGPLGMKIGME